MRLITILIVVISLLSDPLLAGESGEQYAVTSSSTAFADRASYVIMLSQQFDAGAFKKRFTMANSSRAERHALAITTMQQLAAESQNALLPMLQQLADEGKVGQIRPYWIVNCIIADLSDEAIEQLRQRPEIEGIYPWREPELIRPVDYQSAPPVTTRVERGLQVIGAQQMWNLGYTGVGRLVANIDTGVDGTHPALITRWRGNNGHPARECWLDTTDPNSTYPYDSDSHGTHTMGTMTGLGATTGDTIGVAFGAQWIAARAIVTGGNVVSAFQWLAEPDGNPYTIDDVPDVISNSWGYHDFSCPQTIWTLIDNCEAAEIAVVFAAGNRQVGDPYDESVWAPASRTTTPYNAFSVGAIDGNISSFPIADFSARGPSQCDHISKKPEVVAPGVSVRSSVPGGGYQQSGWSGTSMATPHVAGAIALLRQYNPNASVDTLKWALMQSALDLGAAGEDNTYGYGLINIPAAMALVPPDTIPYLRLVGVQISEPNNNQPDPGDTISIVVTLKNTGAGTHSISARLATTDPYATVLQDSGWFGDIPANDSARNDATAYVVAISGITPIGRHLAMNLFVHGPSVADTLGFSLVLGQPAAEQIATHNIGSVEYTISNFAQYGLDPGGLNPNWMGRGFRTPRNSTNYLFEGALLIGVSATRLSNSARNENQEIISGFLPTSTIQQLSPGPNAPQEFICSFNDQSSPWPLNITVQQTTYAWATAGHDNYIITRFEITNHGYEHLLGVRVALFQDWDIPWSSPSDLVNFDRSRRLGYQYSGSNYRGTMVLNPEGVASFKALRNSTEVYPPHFTLADKWSYMTSGITDTAILSAIDASIMITTGPFEIPPESTVIAAFAILGARSLALLQQAADSATAKYNQITSIAEQPSAIIPDQTTLLPNYPNPFNSTTYLRYMLDRDSWVRVEIFDLLGRKVSEPVNGIQTGGKHSILWNAYDKDGQPLASGIYFAKLWAQGKSESRRLLLLR